MTNRDTTILYAMAAEAEYGRHLAERCDPVWTGVGPVEAGVAVAAELARRAAHQQLPELVVSLEELRQMPELAECRLLARGNRLSVLPLTDEEFDAIVAAADAKRGRGRG